MLDEKASRWRQEFEDHDDEVGERKDVASRWQQYSGTDQKHMFRSATLTKVDNPKRKHTVGNLWWNNSSPPRQATLAMERGSTSMSSRFFQLEAAPASRWQRWEVELDDVGWQGEHTIQG